MSIILVLLASASFNWEVAVLECQEAVRQGNRIDALRECDLRDERIDLFDPESDYESPSCAEALHSGKRWAEVKSPLFLVTGSLRKEFYEKMELCINPPKPEEPTPTRKVPQLWD